MAQRVISKVITDLQCWKSTYSAFLASNGVIWIGKRMPPISEDILIYFVVQCLKNLKLLHTTIKLYLCGIRFHYVSILLIPHTNLLFLD